MSLVPSSDSYVRYYDYNSNPPGWRYAHLLEGEGPLHYPFRFPSLAAGAKQSNPTTIDEAKPRVFEPRGTNHLYCALLGLWPGFRYFIYHPYDHKRLMFDERVTDIDEDTTANLVYDDSPHDAPKFTMWISNKLYPAVQPQNIGAKAGRAQVELQITRFRFLQHDLIPLDVRQRLVTGAIPSRPIIFGGEY